MTNRPVRAVKDRYQRPNALSFDAKQSRFTWTSFTWKEVYFQSIQDFLSFFPTYQIIRSSKFLGGSNNDKSA